MTLDSKPPRKRRGQPLAEQSPDRMPIMPPPGSVETIDILQAQAPSDVQRERAEQEIEELISEVGTDAIVRIQRVNPDTGVAAFVGNIPARDFSLEGLADTFGGGRYHLRLYIGKEQQGGRFIQEVDPTIPPKNPRAPKGSVAQLPGGSSGFANDALLSIVTSAANANQQTMTMMTTMMTAVMAMMKGMADIRGPQRDPMDIALKMTELVNSGKATEKTPLSELMAMLEFTDKIIDRRGGSGGETNELDLVKDGIGAIRDIVAMQKKNAPPARLPSGNPPVVRAGVTPGMPVTPLPSIPAQPGDTITVGPALRPWHAAVTPVINQLRSMIGFIRPDTAADLIEQKLDDASWADLVVDLTQSMNNGDAITAAACLPFAARTIEVFQLPPDSQTWLAEVGKELLEIANDGEEDGEESEESSEPSGPVNATE